MSVVESWSRVMDLLQEHAPADHADLAGPATEQMLVAAEERMNISLPQDLRAWLLQNNLDLPEEDVDDDVACCGFAGFPDEGSFFLGIRSMEKLYANHYMSGGINPPDQPDNPFWRNKRFQRCLSRVRTALAIDVMRLGLTRHLRKIRQDFSSAMPRSTGARDAASARLIVRCVGDNWPPGGRLRPVVTQGPAPW